MTDDAGANATLVAQRPLSARCSRQLNHGDPAEVAPHRHIGPSHRSRRESAERRAYSRRPSLASCVLALGVTVRFRPVRRWFLQLSGIQALQAYEHPRSTLSLGQLSPVRYGVMAGKFARIASQAAHLGLPPPD
jgi:hypothetical protein